MFQHLRKCVVRSIGKDLRMLLVSSCETRREVRGIWDHGKDDKIHDVGG
jgi:hypothetical protein